MFILGVSDALRGIFSPLFISSFGFSTGQIGLIVSASYLGNLICLLSGGIILDKIGIRRAFILFISIMAFSEMLLIFGYQFALLLAGFFVSLGMSTLLNTTINLISDAFSKDKSLTFLNILFFLQGIGTSGSQMLLSKYSYSRTAWNITLLTIALLLLPVILMIQRAPGIEDKFKNRSSGSAIGKTEKGGVVWLSLVFLMLALAFYMIAEHGVTNYFMIYGTGYLACDPSTVGKILASFSVGIMSGRLLFGIIMPKVGEKRMVVLSLIAASITYVAVYVFSLPLFLFPAGLSCAIVYPTLVAFIRRFVPSAVGARATTAVVAVASIFDVAFNSVFGYAISFWGYRIAMYALPICMAASLLLVIPVVSQRKV